MAKAFEQAMARLQAAAVPLEDAKSDPSKHELVNTPQREAIKLRLQGEVWATDQRQAIAIKISEVRWFGSHGYEEQHCENFEDVLNYFPQSEWEHTGQNITMLEF